MISRERGAISSDGANQGAPHAIQIADRFHLIMNLREVVESILKRLRAALFTSLPNTESPAEAPPFLTSGWRVRHSAMRSLPNSNAGTKKE